MQNFSSTNRNDILNQLAENQFDILIIGGGITGAGIALDAASRGLKTALIEKNDFASGTSNKSTKLIHGGLRYLKQLEFKLVREVGQERKIVHRMAPNLVVAEKMLLPFTRGGSFGKFSTSIGLWIYDFLAGVKAKDRRQLLSKEQTLEKEPLLDAAEILGGGYYVEYRTDDSRLTVEIVKAATRHGAVCGNYFSAQDFVYENGRVTGLVCSDQFSAKVFTIRSKVVVNATGPWVDQLRKIDKSLNKKRLFLSKGAHLVISRKKFPLSQAIYFDAGDGRMIFCIPRHRSVYVGTTDTPYTGDPDIVKANLEDINYLLSAVNRVFPSAHLNVKDVESSWAGLRPLIYEEGKLAREMSRKDEIFVSPSGLISIAGGKLTGFRKMAEKVVDLVISKKQGQKLRSKTREISLSGNNLQSAADVQRFKENILPLLKNSALEADWADYLVFNYGENARLILEKMQNYSHLPEINLGLAEAWYCIHFEFAVKALDFFNRRTGRLYFYTDSVTTLLEPVLDEFQKQFFWTEERRAAERNEVMEAMYAAQNFSD